MSGRGKSGYSEPTLLLARLPGASYKKHPLQRVENASPILGSFGVANAAAKRVWAALPVARVQPVGRAVSA